MALVNEFRAGDLREALLRISGVLQDHADALDSLDGPDTGSAGSAIATTMSAALEGTEAAGDLVSLTSLLERNARGAPTAKEAWIVGELFGAFAEVSSGADVINAEKFALILELTAEKIQGGAVEPGGLRAVVTASSVGALRAVDQGLSLAETVISAADEGLDELESGVGVNPRLANDGVVDAAGAAFLLFLDSMAAVVTGDPLPQAPVSAEAESGSSGCLYSIACEVKPASAGPGPAKQTNEQSSWIESCSWLESTWNEMGRLTRFDMNDGRCFVGLETSDPGRALETLCSIGLPSELKIGLVGAGSTGEVVGSPSAAHTSSN